jgi:hypothetical protein
MLLSRLDSAWRLAARSELVPHLPVGVIVAGLAPLVLVALAGIRRPDDDMMERALLLWVPLSLAAYVFVSAFPTHALEGISLPLAVLMVRGCRRLRLPVAVGALAVAGVTLPGMAYVARGFHRVADSPQQEYYLTSSESRALDWIAHQGPPGGVLAPPLFAVAVPSQTDRPVWVGHQFWSRDYLNRARAAEALFKGELVTGEARRLVSQSGARFVVSDCSHRTDLAAGAGRPPYGNSGSAR